jgi:signal transduction histidine kinase
MSDLSAHDSLVSFGPSECREANHWWTIARVVSNVLHDVRNSLQIISGNAEMLLLRPDLDDVTRRRLTGITTQTTACVERMDNLYGYTRDVPEAAGRADLWAVAATALAFRSVSLGRGGVASSIAPISGPPILVSCPPRDLLQLLLNLVLEAERHVFGREEASITVSAEPRGRDAVVAVEGRAHGGPSANARASAVAEAVSSMAIAELTRSCGGGLVRDCTPDAIRLALSLPTVA